VDDVTEKDRETARGVLSHYDFDDDLFREALEDGLSQALASARASERDRCAKICDELERFWRSELAEDGGTIADVLDGTAARIRDGAARSEASGGWIPTSERTPTKEDGRGDLSCVLGWSDGDYETTGVPFKKWREDPRDWPEYWMPLPKSPALPGAPHE